MTTVHTAKSKGKFAQNFVPFSEYMNYFKINIWPSDGRVIIPSTHRLTVLYWRLLDFRMLGCHLHAKQGLMWAISVWHVSLNLLSHLDNCTIFTAWVSRFFFSFFPVTYWFFPKEIYFETETHFCWCVYWKLRSKILLYSLSFMIFSLLFLASRDEGEM